MADRFFEDETEANVEPLVINEQPRPTGAIIEQNALRRSPDLAPAPGTNVEAFAEGAPTRSPLERSAAPEKAFVPETPAAEYQSPFQAAPIPEARFDQASPFTQSTPIAGPNPALLDAADQALRPAPTPFIPHRMYEDPRLEAQVQERDQRTAERARRDHERKQREILRGLKDQGVELETDFATGQTRPKRDRNGRVLFKPGIISPLEQDEDGSYYSLRRDQYGNEHKAPIKPKIDKESGHRFVMGSDGVSKIDLGPDEEYIMRRDARAAQEIATNATQNAKAIKEQLDTITEEHASLANRAVELARLRNPTDDQRVELERLRSQAAIKERQRDQIEKQYSQFNQEAISAREESLRRRTAVVDRVRARYGSQSSTPESNQLVDAFSNPSQSAREAVRLPETASRYQQMLGGAGTESDLARLAAVEEQNPNLLPQAAEIIRQARGAGQPQESPAQAAMRAAEQQPLDFFDKLKDIKDNPSQLVPFIAGASDILEMGELGMAAYRITQSGKDGEEPTQADINLIKEYQERNQRDSTFAYKVSSVLAMLPSFAGELYLTRGIGTKARLGALASGRAALKYFGTKAGAEILERASERVAAKAAGEVVENVLGRTAGEKGVEFAARAASSIVGSAAQTLPASGLRITAGTMENMLPAFSFTDNEKNELAATLEQEGDDFATAAVKAFGDNFIEVMSEQSGGALAFIPGANKLKMLKASLAKRWFGMNPDAPAGAFTKLVRGAGWNGVLGEMAEERFGDVARSAVGLQSWSDAIPSVEQLMVEAVAFMIPGAAINATNALINRQREAGDPLPGTDQEQADNQDDIQKAAEMMAVIRADMEGQRDLLQAEVDDASTTAERKAEALREIAQIEADLQDLPAVPAEGDQLQEERAQIREQGADLSEEGQARVQEIDARLEQIGAESVAEQPQAQDQGVAEQEQPLTPPVTEQGAPAQEGVVNQGAAQEGGSATQEPVVDRFREQREAARLPRDLAGAQPRYKSTTLMFSNDVDKAAYIIAQEKPSKRDADYLRFLMESTGMDETVAREYGQEVRRAVAAAHGRANSNTTHLSIPSQWDRPSADTTAAGERTATPPPAQSPAKKAKKPSKAALNEVVKKIRAADKRTQATKSVRSLGGIVRHSAKYEVPFEAKIGDDGRFELRINPERVARAIEGMDQQQVQAWIDRATEEEIIHLASFEAVSREYERANGRKPSLLELLAAIKAEYARVEKAMTTEQRAFVKEAYERKGQDNLTGWRLGAEYVRMLVQMDRSQLPTEATIRNFVERILQVLSELLNNQSTWSPAIDKAYNDTRRVLAEIDAKIAEQKAAAKKQAPVQQEPTVAPPAEQPEQKPAAKKQEKAPATKEKPKSDTRVPNREQDRERVKKSIREKFEGLLSSQPDSNEESASERIVEALLRAAGNPKENTLVFVNQTQVTRGFPDRYWRFVVPEFLPNGVALIPYRPSSYYGGNPSDALRIALGEAFDHSPNEYWRGTNNRNEPAQSGEITSINHATGRSEGGLSVSEGLGGSAFHGYKYYYKVTGDVAGTGSDGEPVLINARALTPIMSIKQAADLDKKERGQRLRSHGWTEDQWRAAIQYSSNVEPAIGIVMLDAPVPLNTDGLRSSVPDALETEQASLPRERLAQFLDLANELLDIGVNTPEGMVRIFDEVDPRLRKYSQAMWGALSAVDVSLAGTHNWNEIYAAIDGDTTTEITEDQEAAPRQTGETGSEWTALVPSTGQETKGRYQLVDAGELVTSDSRNYDQTLQPRDRTRAASRDQVADMAINWQPQRAGEASTTDLGAPIIDESNQVLSGNGRTMARRELSETKEAEYRHWLKENASTFGINPETVDSMKRPMLVRQITDFGNLTPQQFAEESNRQQVLGMSDAEKAASDARLLEGNPRLLEMFRPSEEGNVLAASNRGFLNEFIRATGARAELLSGDGYNQAALTRRVKNAVLARLIGPENRDLLTNLTENADALGLTRLTNALLNVSPRLVNLIGTPHDIAPVLSKALTDLASIKNSGETVSDFLNQETFFGDPNRTMTTDFMLEKLAGFKSTKAATEFFNTYADLAARQDTTTEDMFGSGISEPIELLRTADEKTTQPKDGQGSLAFGESQQRQEEPASADEASDAGGRGSSETEGVTDGRTTGTSLESDRTEPSVANEGGRASVSDDGRADDADGGSLVRLGEGSKDAPVADFFGDQVPSVPSGARGDWGVRGSESELQQRDTGDAGRAGRRRTDAGGQDAEQGRENSFDSHLTVAGSTEPVAGSSAADAGVNREGWHSVLQDAQVQDGQFIENRLYTEGHPGVLLTNGTGTGKTFSGLGVVKRRLDAGAKAILVAAPSQSIADDWRRTAQEHFGINGTEILPDIRSNGGRNRLVITTYANLGQNLSLINREWDMVITDESHHLSQSADGNLTNAYQALAALTKHPNGAWRRAEMRHPKEMERLGELSKILADSGRLSPKQDQERDRILQLINDEAGKERKAIEKIEASDRPKTVMLSATPFAYHFSLDYAEGFLFNYPAENERTKGVYGHATPRSQFYINNFGYRMRTGDLTKPESAIANGILERRFADNLMASGAMRGRALEVDQDYSREFAVTNNALGEKLDQVIEAIEENPRYRPLMKYTAARDWLERRMLLEALKARDAVPRIKKHLKLGRKVVVIHDFKKGGASNPLRFILPEGLSYGYTDLNRKWQTVDGHEALQEIKDMFPWFDEAKKEFDGLTAPIQTLQKAFPKLLVFNGDVSKQDRLRRRAAFNKSGSKYDVILAQRASVKEGNSLHDTDGKHQRVLIDLGIPGRPTDAIQTEGRIYRTGVRSNAVIEYLVTGTNFERWAFAATIATRASAAENLAMGSRARSLLQSFADGFNNASVVNPSKNQGKGGKAFDRRAAATSPFDEAVALYQTTQKQRQGRRGREGDDYYATPEPVGFKMVEWGDIAPGEKVLEPSAGHGAIARFFPDSTSRHAVEPSRALSTRLALNATDIQIHNTSFEDYYVGNKFNVITMNPPFGTNGKTAAEHITKAAKMLNPGGRLVALIPDGPAMEKRYRKFLEEKGSGADLVQVAEFTLPPVAFERAGTGVSTRIVILDKPVNDEQRDRLSKAARLPVQITGETVQELFDDIRGASVPPRLRDAGQPAPKATDVVSDSPAMQSLPPTDRETTWVPESFNHTTQGHQIHVAKIARRLSKDEFAKAKDRAKSHGGYYSGYNKGGAIPGFHFRNETDRDAFMSEGMDAPKAKHEASSMQQLTPTLREIVERRDSGQNNEQIAREMDRTPSSVETAYRAAQKQLGRHRDQTAEANREDQESMRDAQGLQAAVPESRTPQTETPAFKRWFGDSKVVDAEGKPLVVYHGAKSPMVGESFRMERGALGTGAYFTSDPTEAEGFTQNAIWKTSPNIIPAYIQISNPFIVQSPWAKVPKNLLEQGYDGVILEEGGLIKWAIPMRPEQIKSAIGNRGTFNPSDPSILRAPQPEQADDPRSGVLLSAYRDLPDNERKILALKAQGVRDAQIARQLRMTPQAMAAAYQSAIGKLNKARATLEGFPGLADKAMKEKKGERTIGRPDLANVSKGTKSRRLESAVDEARKQAGTPATLHDQEVIKEAQARLRKDYNKERENIIRRAETGASLDPYETVIAKTIVARESLSAIRSRSTEKMLEFAKIFDVYRITGTEQARAFRLRADWTKSPAERAVEYIAKNILTPPQKVTDKIDREKDLEKRERDLANWTKRVNKVKARLKAIGLDLDVMTDEQIIEFLNQPGKARTAAGVIADTKKDFWDALYEWWLSSILSNPATQVANIVGNTANAFWDFTAQRFMESSVNLATGNLDGAQFGEFRYLMKGILPGLSQGMKNFVASYRDENTVFQESVLGEEGRTKLEYEHGRAIPGKAGKVIRTPLRLLQAVDEMSKTLFANMQVGAEAYRIAKREKLSGDAMAKRIDELTRINPDNPSQAWINAASKSVELTFQQELGPAGKWMNATRRRFRALNYVVPFVQTPVNIFKTGLRKSPLGTLPLLYRLSRAGLVKLNMDKSGWTYTKNDFAPQFAEQILAWGGMLAIAALVAPDDDGIPWITGTVPFKGTNRGQRDLAYRTAPPMSIRVGGKWYSYARVEPAAVMISSVVDLFQSKKEYDHGADATAVIGKTFTRFMGQFKEKTFMRGVSDILNAVEEGASVVDWAGDFAVSWVPNIVRAGARNTDDVLREQKIWGQGDEWSQSFVEALKYKALPFANDIVQPKVDLWGRDITKTEGASPQTDWLARMFSISATKDHNPNMLDRLIVNWNNQNPEQTIAPSVPAPFWRIKQPGEVRTRTHYMSREEYHTFLVRSGIRAAQALERRPLNVNNPTEKDIGEIQKAIAKARREVRQELWKERQRRALQ